ncbi:MAG: hypothetical protein GY906_28470 [bacterium]|nr:hypothetical protein [bacterium]
MRKFDTGATRDSDDSKFDYEGFLSHPVLVRFAEYMHSHRVQADGNMRDSDNWQKGIPQDAYMKSAWRHFMDWWHAHRTKGDPAFLQESMCALLFNVMGYMHEELKKEASPLEKIKRGLDARVCTQCGFDRTESRTTFNLTEKTKTTVADGTCYTFEESGDVPLLLEGECGHCDNVKREQFARMFGVYPTSAESRPTCDVHSCQFNNPVLDELPFEETDDETLKYEGSGHGIQIDTVEPEDPDAELYELAGRIVGFFLLGQHTGDHRDRMIQKVVDALKEDPGE